MVSDKKLRNMDGIIDEFRMRIKDSSQRAVFSDVFDDATLMALYELSKKEFKNLKRAEEAGVRVPKPYVTKRNILLMEFIGKEGIPMPQLKDIKLTHEETAKIFKMIVDYMNLLY